MRFRVGNKNLLQVPTRMYLFSVVFDYDVIQLTDVHANELEHIRGIAFELELVAGLGAYGIVAVEQVFAWQITSLATYGHVYVGVSARIVKVARFDFDSIVDFAWARFFLFEAFCFLQKSPILQLIMDNIKTYLKNNRFSQKTQ